MGVKNLLFFINTIIFPVFGLICLYFIIVQFPLNNEDLYYTSILNESFFSFIKITAFLIIWIFLSEVLNYKKSNNRLNISIIDVLLGLYFVYSLFSYFLIVDYQGISGKLIEVVVFAILYIIFRKLSKSIQYFLLFLIIVSGIIQAVYGVLQIYGVYPSNHNLFNITGGFFNPGPYAGYLSGIWPIAFSIYLFRKKLPTIKISRNNLVTNYLLKILFYTINLKKFYLFSKNKKSIPDNSIISIQKEQKHIIVIQKIEILLTNIVYNYFPFVCLSFILFVIPTTMSRAAWLSIFVSSSIIAIIKFSNKNLINKLFNTKLKRFVITTNIILFVIAGIYGMYYLKKDSANGRIVIWKATGKMIADNFITGVGFGKYEAHYMDYQANYLKGKEDTQEAYLAGETNYAYNTILKQIAELGFVGLILIILILYSIFKQKIKNLTKIDDLFLLSAKTALLGIIIFSMFSYPEHIISIKIIFISLLAFISNKNKTVTIKGFNYKTNSKQKLVIKTFLLLLIIIGNFISIPIYKKFYKATNSWKNANFLYNVTAYNDCIKDFEIAYPVLKNNGQFLLNYGKALSMAEKHKNAIKILTETEKHLKNTIVYTTMGNSYKVLGLTKKAEKAYKKAWQMIPSRFYAKYLLAKLYDETGQNKKAKNIANELLIKKVKIHSTAIYEIKIEMAKILKNNGEK